MQPAIFSPDRVYRYVLWREWLIGAGIVMFIGLNPSTADETHDDPTVRRCIDYAKRWGYRALYMTNLFAFRSTFPRVMMGYPQPVGFENDRWLVACARESETVVAAWGKDGVFSGRDSEVMKLLDGLQCFGTNANGTPKHPLYLPKILPLQPYLGRPEPSKIPTKTGGKNIRSRCELSL